MTYGTYNGWYWHFDGTPTACAGPALPFDPAVGCPGSVHIDFSGWATALELASFSYTPAPHDRMSMKIWGDYPHLTWAWDDVENWSASIFASDDFGGARHISVSNGAFTMSYADSWSVSGLLTPNGVAEPATLLLVIGVLLTALVGVALRRPTSTAAGAGRARGRYRGARG